MKYYVVSDVHGHYSLMISALRQKGFFNDKSPHKLIVCGDILDRGKEAQKLVNFILDEIKKEEIILIRGNHEDLFVEMTDRFRQEIASYIFGFSAHIQNGTFDSAKQLIDMSDDEIFSNAKSFQNKLRQTPFYQQILPICKNYYETNNYIFVHGYIPTIRENGEYMYDKNWRNADENAWRKARWLNGAKLHFSGIKEDGKTIVCGHVNASYAHSKLENKGSEWKADADFTPYYAEGIISIDACTAFTKMVNVLVVEE